MLTQNIFIKEKDKRNIFILIFKKKYIAKQSIRLTSTDFYRLPCLIPKATFLNFLSS